MSHLNDASEPNPIPNPIIDPALDRVLHALRDAEPSPGMNRRILATLEARAAAPRRSVTHLWAFATAGIAIVALALAWATTHRTHTTSQTIATIPHTAPAIKPIPQPVQQPRDAIVHTPQHQDRIQPAQPEPAPSTPETSEEAAAFADLHAPSQPAPPLPLTEQEELLLGVVHRGDPVELAMLDPRLRSSEQASSRADFDRFFPSSHSPFIKPSITPPSTTPKTGDNK